MKPNWYKQDFWLPVFALGRLIYNALNTFLITFAALAGVWAALRIADIAVPKAVLDERERGTQSEADMIQAHHDALYGVEADHE